MRKKARRRKKNPVANELPKYDWINVNGRMYKRPLRDSVNQVKEEIIAISKPKERPSVDKKAKEKLCLRDEWEQQKQLSMVHDEFSAKSIAISLAVAASILAAAFFFAKSIVDIMNK